MMIEYVLANPLAAWGALLSTMLAGIKLYETFWKERIRLESTFSLTGDSGAPHEITLVNLSTVPVQVSHWTLAWEPRWYRPTLPSKDVSPDETGRFKIEGRGERTILFDGQDKFAWDHSIAKGRRLVMRLYIFGKRGSIRLIIGAGQ